MEHKLITEFAKDVTVHLNTISSSINALKTATSERACIRLLNDIHSAADCITELVDGESFEDGNDGVLLKIVEH